MAPWFRLGTSKGLRIGAVVVLALVAILSAFDLAKMVAGYGSFIGRTRLLSTPHRRVQVGMEKSEVVRLLGKPKDVAPNIHCTTWYYDEQEISRGEHGSACAVETAVYFGVDDRVTDVRPDCPLIRKSMSKAEVIRHLGQPSRHRESRYFVEKWKYRAPCNYRYTFLFDESGKVVAVSLSYRQKPLGFVTETHR